MLDNWSTKKLGEIALVKGGKRMPKGWSLTESVTNHPYIRVTNMGKKKVPKEELLYVPNEVFEKISRYTVSKDDVIISIVGTIGSVAIIDEELDKANLTENCVKLTKLKNFDSEYLYYYLSSTLGQAEIAKGIVGSTQPKLPLYNIKNINVPNPAISEQKAIASILSALDDKIENNLQMNKTLEQMAMALYKHWFVDFGPFQDGKFVNSELGEIPKGWEVKKLKAFYKNSQYGFTQSSSTEKIGPKFLRITDIQGGTVQWGNVPYCRTNQKQYKKYKIVKGDIFVARTGNSTGENTYIINPPNAVFASYLIRFQFEEVFRACYVAKHFRSKAFSDFINGAKVGSAQPGISASAIGEIKMIIPTDQILYNFFNVVNDIDVKRESNIEENLTLSELRDILLQKLISGDITVKNVEKTLSEVL